MNKWLWDRWLTLHELGTHDWFEQFLFVEDATLRPCVKAQLAELVHWHHDDDLPSANLIQLLGYPLLARGWRQQSSHLPQNAATEGHLTTRRGNFGEVLLVDFMRNVLGMEVPVCRLRYNPNPDQAMKGDDGLGFVHSSGGDITEVSLGESKYRSDKTPSSCKQAIDDALSSLAGGPKSMDFVATILDLQGAHNDAQRVRQARARLANKAIQCRSVLMLLTLGQPADPFASVVNSPQALGLSRLTAINVSFATGIQDWLNELFDA